MSTLPELTAEEIQIAAMQKSIKQMGWQWMEHIFNDGSCADCYLKLTSRKNPTELSRGHDIGWGRFARLYCWKEAHKWIVGRNGDASCP